MLDQLFSILSKNPDSDYKLLRDEIQRLKSGEAHLQEKVAKLEADNITLSRKAKQLAQELDSFRQRRLVYWSDRFRNSFDAWHLMHPGFEELKDDSVVFNSDLKGFRLLPSVNLFRVSSLQYELNLGRAGLSAILLAPILDAPSQCGEISIKIFDESQGTISSNCFVELSRPLSAVSEQEPLIFEFPSSIGAASEGRLFVQVYVQDIDVPVRLFELRRYPMFGFMRLQRRLFASYRFES